MQMVRRPQWPASLVPTAPVRAKIQPAERYGDKASCICCLRPQRHIVFALLPRLAHGPLNVASVRDSLPADIENDIASCNALLCIGPIRIDGGNPDPLAI